MLKEKSIKSKYGKTFYYISETKSDIALCFLPGLTADHRLFEQQTNFFRDKYKVIVWDAPCHGKSRPYSEFSYMNITNELYTILTVEEVKKVVIIGQSLGGMVAQYYIDRFPKDIIGFVSIDSVPFGDYYSKSDLFWLSQLEWMCNMFPDKMLRNSMAKMCATNDIGRNRMLEMLSIYDKKELCHLMYIGEASFIPENKEINLPCKTILLLGDKDNVGKVKSYTKEWTKRTGYPLYIIKDAAHNSNDDNPDEVNKIIFDFVKGLE